MLYFILSSFICQDSSFTLPPPQFPCSHLLTTGIKVSKQYWHWVWQPIKVLPNTQYYPILENIGQQCQYCSNPSVVLKVVFLCIGTFLDNELRFDDFDVEWSWSLHIETVWSARLWRVDYGTTWMKVNWDPPHSQPNNTLCAYKLHYYRGNITTRGSAIYCISDIACSLKEQHIINCS